MLLQKFEDQILDTQTLASVHNRTQGQGDFGRELRWAEPSLFGIWRTCSSFVFGRAVRLMETKIQRPLWKMRVGYPNPAIQTSPRKSADGSRHNECAIVEEGVKTTSPAITEESNSRGNCGRVYVSWLLWLKIISESVCCEFISASAICTEPERVCVPLDAFGWTSNQFDHRQLFWARWLKVDWIWGAYFREAGVCAVCGGTGHAYGRDAEPRWPECFQAEFMGHPWTSFNRWESQRYGDVLFDG